MVIGAPHIDQAVKAPLKFVGVISDVGGEVGPAPVALLEHAVLVALLFFFAGSDEPNGAVGIFHEAPPAQLLDMALDQTLSNEPCLAEPGIKLHPEFGQ